MPNALPFKVYVQLYTSAYVRKQWDDDWLLSADWEFVESGGTGKVEITIARLYDTAVTGPGDIVEIWVQGESVPRVRAIVSGPEAKLDLKEQQVIVAYGRMVDMDWAVVNKLLMYAGGQDASYYYGLLLADYEARLKAQGSPFVPFSRDINLTGVTVVELNLTNTTLKSGADKLFALGASNLVWGWDVDPVLSTDRFYVRQRVAGVANQWFVGENVKLVDAPIETVGYQFNAARIKGGPAQYPQLVNNADFEVPVIASALASDNVKTLITDGGFEEFSFGGDSGNAWNFTSGTDGSPSINTNNDRSNHPWTAYSGSKFVLLDDNTGTDDAIFQVVDLEAGLPTQQYQFSLNYAGTDDIEVYYGEVSIVGLASDGTTVTETPSNSPFGFNSSNPSNGDPSDIWQGGQPSTALAGNGFSGTVVFTNPLTVKAKITIALVGSGSPTGAGSANHGLLIDNVTFAAGAALGQQGFGTHNRHSSDTNTFQWVDWANTDAAWSGYYGVRCQVTATSSDRPCLGLNPQNGPGGSGYHFQPQTGQGLRPGVRVRMKPELNSADGAVVLTYREWDSSGNQTQVQYTNQSGGTTVYVDGYPFPLPGDGGPLAVPNDGNWYALFLNVTADYNAASATVQIEFGADGIYDVDGFTCRDQAAGEFTGLVAGSQVNEQNTIDPNYLSTTDFEKYVRVDDADIVAATDPSLTTAAANSIADYGLKECVLDNDDIVNWSAATIQYMVSWFNRNAIPLERPKVELAHEAVQVPTPGSGLQLQVSGTKSADLIEWMSRVAYTWEAAALKVSIEATNERPTEAKLLLAAMSSGGGSGSAGGIAGAAASGAATNGGGTSTGSAGGIDVTDGTTDLPNTVELFTVPTDFAIQDSGQEAGVSVIALQTTGVDAGTYSFLRATFDAKGRALAAQDPNVAHKTANYTILATDDVLTIDATSGTITLTLPAASASAGKIVMAVKTDSSTHAVNVTAAGSDTVDGTTAYALSSQWMGAILVCDGSAWYVVAFYSAALVALVNTLVAAVATINGEITTIDGTLTTLSAAISTLDGEVAGLLAETPFVWMGDWNSSTAYAVGNAAMMGGSLWYATANNTNQSPPTLPTTSNSYWTLMVPGVPPAGSASNTLTKNSDTDYDYGWGSTPGTGGGDGGYSDGGWPGDILYASSETTSVFAPKGGRWMGLTGTGAPGTAAMTAAYGSCTLSAPLIAPYGNGLTGPLSGSVSAVTAALVLPVQLNLTVLLPGGPVSVIKGYVINASWVDTMAVGVYYLTPGAGGNWQAFAQQPTLVSGQSVYTSLTTLVDVVAIGIMITDTGAGASATINELLAIDANMGLLAWPEIEGSRPPHVTLVTGDYTLNGYEEVVLCDTTGGALTVTLCTAAVGSVPTKRRTIVNWAGSANVTIVAAGSETIVPALTTLTPGQNAELLNQETAASGQEWLWLNAGSGGGVSLTSSTPSAETIGASGAVGTATDAARADHVHGMPSAATIAGALTSYFDAAGAASAALTTAESYAATAASAALSTAETYAAAQAAAAQAAAEAYAAGLVGGGFSGLTWQGNFRS